MPTPRVYAARPSRLGASTPRRGGLCTPAMTESRQARHYPLLPPAHRQPTRGNEVPWHPDGCTKRTRRPRPSDKIAYPRTSYRKAISPGSLHPPEGRAPHAREERDGFDRGMCPVGHRPLAYLSAVMPYLGLRTALPLERGDRAPPRKSASSLWQGFPRAAIRAGLAPLEGRAPHAREGGIAFTDAYHR